MNSGHLFGGSWTEEKLELLTKYLKAYIRIFTVNPRARLLHTIYVDAFTGTGLITQQHHDETQAKLFEDLTGDDAQGFMKGSALRALELEPGFNEYLFIKKDPKRFSEVNSLSRQHQGKSVTVKNVEANEYLRKWCATIDWRTKRALVFLDPYGMQVDWSLIED